MIPTYNDYLKERNSLTFDEMQKIHADMVAGIGSDTDALELYGELLRTAVKYAGIRAKCPLLPKQDKIDQEKDERRTMCHDSLLIKIEKMHRFQRTVLKKESSWRETLGEDRKRIGDFACYLAFVESLYAR